MPQFSACPSSNMAQLIADWHQCHSSCLPFEHCGTINCTLTSMSQFGACPSSNMAQLTADSHQRHSLVPVWGNFQMHKSSHAIATHMYVAHKSMLWLYASCVHSCHVGSFRPFFAGSMRFRSSLQHIMAAFIWQKYKLVIQEQMSKASEVRGFNR